jgi:hypothetical protein
MYKTSVRTSQDTYYASAAKIMRLMLFREIIAVYYKNHIKHANTLCGQNAEFWYVKAVSTYSHHWAVQG